MEREVYTDLFVMSVPHPRFMEGERFLLHYDHLARELISMDDVWRASHELPPSDAPTYLSKPDEVDGP